MLVRARLKGTPQPMQMLRGADGLEIAADTWGVPGNPLVLLQHGGGQTRHAWKNTGMVLADAGFHVFALDARGHGDSGWAPAGLYEQDDMVSDIVEIAAEVSDEPPILVGASMGGGVSLCAVGEARIKARALVLVDMAPKLEADGTRRIIEFMQQAPNGFDSLEDVAQAISNYQPHRKRPRSLDGLRKNVRVDENGRLHWHWDPRWLVDKPSEVPAGMERLQHATLRVAEIGLPTLLVRGGMSDVLSEEGARAFLDACPHAEYVNVADAAHMVAGDRNDRFSEAVVGFLNIIANSSAYR